MNQQLQIRTDSSGAVTIDSLLLEPLYENGDIYTISDASLEIWNEDELVATAELRTGADYSNSTILYTGYPIADRTWLENENENLVLPVDGLVDSNVGIYISEESENIINFFPNFEGTGHIEYGSTGSGVGQFLNPRGMAHDSQGRIYIADSSNKRIVRIDDITGANWTEFDTDQENPSSGVPIDVTLDSQGRIYFVYGKQVTRVDDMDADLSTWITYGRVNGTGTDFGFLQSVVIDVDGKIYLADSDNLRIVRMDDMVGNGISEYKPTGDEAFQSISDILINSFCQLYVFDPTASKLVRIDDFDGTNYDVVLPSGTGDFQVNGAQRGDIDNDILYFADNDNDRFVAFSEALSPTSLTASEGLTYEWTSGQIETLSDSIKSNYKAVWNLNNGNRIETRFFDVVYWKLKNPISTVDILNEKPELLTHERPEMLLVSTEDGTTTTLVCDRLTEPTGFYNGSIVQFNSGDNENSIAVVDTWNNETSTLTFHKDLDFATNRKERFVLKRSFNPEINAAWLELFHTIQAWRPVATDNTGLNKLVDSFDLKLVHLYKTVINICTNRRMRAGDTWDLCAKDYSSKYTKALDDLRAKIDEDNDGILEETDEARRGQIWFQH